MVGEGSLLFYLLVVVFFILFVVDVVWMMRRAGREPKRAHALARRAHAVGGFRLDVRADVARRWIWPPYGHRGDKQLLGAGSSILQRCSRVWVRNHVHHHGHHGWIARKRCGDEKNKEWKGWNRSASWARQTDRQTERKEPGNCSLGKCSWIDQPRAQRLFFGKGQQ